MTRRAPRKAFQHVRRNTGNLEIVAFTLDAETQLLELAGQADAEARLEVWGIAFQFPELAGLPAFFLIVPGCVENEDVCMKLGVWQPVHGA